MNFRFLKQRAPESITTLDEIELYNCEDHHMNGNYTVGDVDHETGDVMLVGMGELSGHVTTVCFGDAGPA